MKETRHKNPRIVESISMLRIGKSTEKESKLVICYLGCGWEWRVQMGAKFLFRVVEIFLKVRLW